MASHTAHEPSQTQPIEAPNHNPAHTDEADKVIKDGDQATGMRHSAFEPFHLPSEDAAPRCLPAVVDSTHDVLPTRQVDKVSTGHLPAFNLIAQPVQAAHSPAQRLISASGVRSGPPHADLASTHSPGLGSKESIVEAGQPAAALQTPPDQLPHSAQVDSQPTPAPFQNDAALGSIAQLPKPTCQEHTAHITDAAPHQDTFEDFVRTATAGSLLSRPMYAADTDTSDSQSSLLVADRRTVSNEVEPIQTNCMPQLGSDAPSQQPTLCSLEVQEAVGLANSTLNAALHDDASSLVVALSSPADKHMQSPAVASAEFKEKLQQAKILSCCQPVFLTTKLSVVPRFLLTLLADCAPFIGNPQEGHNCFLDTACGVWAPHESAHRQLHRLLVRVAPLQQKLTCCMLAAYDACKESKICALLAVR